MTSIHYHSIHQSTTVCEESCYKDSLALSLNSKKIKKRTRYRRIDDKVRHLLIEAVITNGEMLKTAAEKLNINYSSAKSIYHTYKREGRIVKKAWRIRNEKKSGGKEITKESSPKSEMSPTDSLTSRTTSMSPKSPVDDGLRSTNEKLKHSTDDLINSNVTLIAQESNRIPINSVTQKAQPLPFGNLQLHKANFDNMIFYNGNNHFMLDKAAHLSSLKLANSFPQNTGYLSMYKNMISNTIQPDSMALYLQMVQQQRQMQMDHNLLYLTQLQNYNNF